MESPPHPPKSMLSSSFQTSKARPRKKNKSQPTLTLGAGGLTDGRAGPAQRAPASQVYARGRAEIRFSDFPLFSPIHGPFFRPRILSFSCCLAPVKVPNQSLQTFRTGGDLVFQVYRHSTQHTTYTTNHTPHNTQHTTHSTQHTAHSTHHTTHATHLAPMLQQRPAAAAMRRQFGAPSLPSRAEH